MQVIAILLILVGEIITIGSELAASKLIATTGSWKYSLMVISLPVFIGSLMLAAGYMFGYLHLKNIWIVVAISIGSILIIEPVLAYLLFKETPTLGAWLGLLCGICGISASLFIR